MNRFTRRMAAAGFRFLSVSALVSLVCLATQVSQASADTFNWNGQFNFRFDVPAGTAGPIPPIDFAWSFEFDPLVTLTDVQDSLPDSLRTFAFFSGAGITTAPTAVTADLLATIPAGATLTNSIYAYGAQAYHSFCNCVLRNFNVQDQWESGDVDADPNVETIYQYFRSFAVGTQTAETAADVAVFDASSIIAFLTATASSNYTPSFVEQLRITTRNLTTGETTTGVTSFSGPGAFVSHVPGSPAPVPEPASMVLVATGLIATAIRKRARLC